jgi:pimeloyl-ACP methyl ester carboxylesterase
MLTDYTYDTGTVELHYVKGPDGGPPLVWLHGATSSWVFGLNYAPWFVLRHTVYAVDFPGHGLSGRVPGRYRNVDFGEDISAFLRDCVKGPAALVGESLGGVVAAYVAGRHPQWVRALAMMDAPLEPALDDSPGMRAWLQQCHDSAAQGLTPAEMRRVRQVRTASDRRWALGLSQLDPQAVGSFLSGAQWEDWDADAILAGIACPTLLLYGDRDKGGLTTPEQAEALRARLPDCVVNHLPMGHVPSPAQRPEAAMIIGEFLESLE